MLALACVYLVLCAHTLQEERGRERRRGTGRERKSTPTWSRNLIKQVKVSNCLGEIILPLMKTGKEIGEGEGGRHLVVDGERDKEMFACVEDREGGGGEIQRVESKMGGKRGKKEEVKKKERVGEKKRGRERER